MHHAGNWYGWCAGGWTRLALGGVDVDAGSGSVVTYTVTASDAIGGAGTTTAPIAYDQNAAMALPDDGVKYYRMKVTTVPAK